MSDFGAGACDFHSDFGSDFRTESNDFASDFRDFPGDFPGEISGAPRTAKQPPGAHDAAPPEAPRDRATGAGRPPRPHRRSMAQTPTNPKGNMDGGKLEAHHTSGKPRRSG